MKYLATLIAALSIGTHTVSAGCFHYKADDPTWKDRDLARYHSERACFGYDDGAGRIAGVFQGVFHASEERRVCINGPDSRRFDFTVKNENTNTGFNLADADCRLRLWNEINGCDYGGKTTTAGWTFTSDPNWGTC